jgi:hypothetical protein
MMPKILLGEKSNTPFDLGQPAPGQIGDLFPDIEPFERIQPDDPPVVALRAYPVSAADEQGRARAESEKGRRSVCRRGTAEERDEHALAPGVLVRDKGDDPTRR